MSVIAATLLTDRKPAFPVSLQYLTQEPLIERIYVNIETRYPSSYSYVTKFLEESGKPFYVDYWNIESNWRQRPEYDQDPKRFAPIAMGRNMTLDWAISMTWFDPNTSHLLFVDSDVRPHPGGLEKLLALQKPITGGVVPGRGAHSHVNYVFGVHDQIGDVIRCMHGTSGYLLLERSSFEVQRFRSGPCIYNRGDFLCDDPAYATDAFHMKLTDYWYIHKGATADHVDDPDRPLTLETAINDYHRP